MYEKITTTRRKDLLLEEPSLKVDLGTR